MAQDDETGEIATRRDALRAAAALGGLGLLAATEAAAAPAPAKNRTGLTADDIAQIHDLLARYAWYLDTHEGEKWADLFAPGGKAVFTRSAADTREKLVAYPKIVNGGTPELRQHHVGNIMIDGDPGGQSCTVRSYMIATLFSRGGDLHAFLASGTYRDKCVKIDGKWFFMERRFAQWDAVLG